MSSLLSEQHVSSRKTETLSLSPFQQRVMAIPERYGIFLGGGRGGGKSYCLAMLALRYAEQYREKARILYVRQTYKGISDWEQICRDIFWKVYGKAARYNMTEKVWTLPTGSYLELGQLESPSDLNKYQGRSFGLLLVDECGQFATPELIDILRSNLRGPTGMPTRQCISANPGGAGHAWLAKRFVFRTAPWMPFTEPSTASQWVYAPSTFRENSQFIDAAEYERNLEAACPSDKELLRAWRDGDWAIARGAYFGSVLDEGTNAIDPWALPLKLTPDRTALGNGMYLQACDDPWHFYLSHDFGVSAPSVTYVVGESPGATGPDGRYYPRGSVLLLDEYATYVPGQLNTGLGYTVPRLAEGILEMCKRWGMKPRGVADDAIFANTGAISGSIGDEFRKAGVTFRPARKADRISGWEILRRMMQDAGKPDKAGFYVARNCSFFWETVPYLPRDPRKANDVQSNGVADHSADAARYAVLRRDHQETRRRTFDI